MTFRRSGARELRHMLPDCFLFRSRPLQRPSRIHAGELAVGECELSVHQHIFHTQGKLRWFGVCGFVNDGCRIKNGEVGEEALAGWPTLSSSFF
jgi:hypothetical protein